MTIQTKILTILFLLSSKTLTKSQSLTSLPLIGIIAQPASTSLNNEFFDADKHWTYIPKSYISWVSQTGAMAVLVPFDLPEDKFTHLLDNIQGFLLPGGGSALLDSKGNPTPFQRRVMKILDFAAKKNDKGIYYPVIGTCFGMQAMTLAFAGNAEGVLTCDFSNLDTHGVITPGYDYDKNVFWNSFSNRTLVYEAWNTGNICYDLSCAFRPSALTNSKAFNENAYLLATSKDKNGKIFAANIEHKRYPFIANQWHPEKTQFERSSSMSFLPRDDITRRFVTEFITKAVENTRPFAKELKDIPGTVKAYFEMYHIPIRPGWDYFEQVYVFPRTDGDMIQEEEEMKRNGGFQDYERAYEKKAKRRLRERYMEMMSEEGFR